METKPTEQISANEFAKMLLKPYRGNLENIENSVYTKPLTNKRSAKQRKPEQP